MEEIFWLSAAGALLALDYAMVGQFMISQPLVLGLIFGLWVGEPAVGLGVGALLQLVWIGVIPVGAYIPSDHTVTTGVTVVLTSGLVNQQGLPLGVALIYALCLAIPAGVVSGKLDIAVRHINSRLVSNVESHLERYGPRGICTINWQGAALTFLRNFLLFLLWLGPVAWGAAWWATQMPAGVAHGFALAFQLLPALCFGVVLDLTVRSRVLGWIVGIFFLVGAVVWIWPQQRLWVFALAAAAGAAVAMRRRAW